LQSLIFLACYWAKSWFFIDKTGDKFYICPLIEKIENLTTILNIKSILKRSRGGDSGNIPI